MHLLGRTVITERKVKSVPELSCHTPLGQVTLAVCITEMVKCKTWTWCLGRKCSLFECHNLFKPQILICKRKKKNRKKSVLWICVCMTSYPVLWQQSASSLRVEYRCRQGQHLGAAGRHQIGWCEMGCRAPLPSSTLPLRFAPRVHGPRSLQLSTTGPAPGLCCPCQIHRPLATWQCHSLRPYVLTMASLTDIPTASDSLVCVWKSRRANWTCKNKRREQWSWVTLRKSNTAHFLCCFMWFPYNT